MLKISNNPSLKGQAFHHPNIIYSTAGGSGPRRLRGSGRYAQEYFGRVPRSCFSEGCEDGDPFPAGACGFVSY